ncbi:N-acetylmuramic acid 6-phosphate etherase [Streptococcus ovis]|uniref:N-acetylmuramic acid 6-phosphate etherase n=1 Tax=Streptococcus ovis TaxID=82806 RepID=UPI000363D055|nr:N-acetylmuramic acid 6-phosphate etherase [Streptococcus ovis]
MSIAQLDTEQKNPQSDAIEEMSIEDITAYINREDQQVAGAVEKSLTSINNAIALVVTTLRSGGRLLYIGAGTSGRLGILDASECPPTYGVPRDLVQGLIAGGKEAIQVAQEGAEDDEEAAIRDLQHIDFSSRDMLIGLAASGRTPYVLSALQYAQSIGAKTSSISCVFRAAISQFADAPIEVLVGPEVITGSSRMKAGTAQKMILNMISTTAMIQLGKIYKGYMVDVQPTNQKLVERALYIIQQTTACDKEEAESVFQAADKNVKLAILMQLSGLSKQESNLLLQEKQGNVALAIKKILHQEEK